MNPHDPTVFRHERLAYVNTLAVETGAPFIAVSADLRTDVRCGRTSDPIQLIDLPHQCSPIVGAIRMKADQRTFVKIHYFPAAATTEHNSMSLTKYVRTVEACPRTTQSQIDRFIEYLRSAHSWYKHLYLCPPGPKFYFYLDPHAGMNIRRDASGRISAVERERNSACYGTMSCTTKQYRDRYGHLTYSVHAGPAFEITDRDGAWVMNNWNPIILTDEGIPYLIPNDLAEESYACLTAVIHRKTLSVLWLKRKFEEEDTPLSSWPEESGGAARLRLIRDTCYRKVNDIQDRIFRGEQLIPHDGRKIRDLRGAEREDRIYHVDQDIKKLMLPEINRQRLSIRQAINRMLNLIH